MQMPQRWERLDSLRVAALAARHLTSEDVKDPRSRFLPLPLQLSFYRDDAKIRIIRTGNQGIGKTTAVLIDAISECIGDHPFREVAPWEGKKLVALICATAEQSLPIQRKLSKLLRPWMLEGGSLHRQFDPTTGYGRPPIIRFPNAELHIKSCSQGELALAGSEYDVIYFDEPMTAAIWSEAIERVSARGGRIAASFTPIGRRDLSWLEEYEKQPHVSVHHSPLTAEALIPVDPRTGESTGKPYVGPDGRPRDQAWIDDKIRDCLPMYRPARIHGAYKLVLEGRVFQAFDEDKHSVAELPDLDWDLSIGIDHGTVERVGKQTAVLVGYNKKHNLAVVFDEWVSEGESSTDDDAAAIINMLTRNGLEWTDLSYAYGDRAVRGTSRFAAKDNAKLLKAIKRQLGVTEKIYPFITVAKRTRLNTAEGYVHSIEWIHKQQVSTTDDGGPRFLVFGDSCPNVIKAFQTWEGGKTEEPKDVLDAVRYGFIPWILNIAGHSLASVKLVV